MFAGEDEFKYNKVCDIYSLGVTFWELATLRTPHHGRNFNQIFNSLVSKRIPLILPNDTQVPETFAALVRSCCELESAQRPTSAQVLRALQCMDSASLPFLPSQEIDNSPSPSDAIEAEALKFQAEHGENALHDACESGHLQLVQWLVTQGKANVNQVCTSGTNKGVTPLHMACGSGHLQVVKWLVTHGKANVDPVCNQDGEGMTPLHAACMNGHVQVVEWLVTQGKADMNMVCTIEGDKNITLLHFACKVGHLQTAEWLVAQGKANVNAVCMFDGDEGVTPLHLACYEGHLQVVKWLVTEGKANVNLKTKKGKRPMDVAREEKRDDVVAFLSNYAP